MRVGLVRHYKVIDHTTNYWMSSKDFTDWITQYNTADIYLQNKITTHQNWERCYSSDMIRAIRTAESIYNGDLIITDLLREIEIGPLFQSNHKLHINMWLIFGRLGWFFKHRSQENKTSTFIRAKKLLDTIEGRGDREVLIVSHGAFMTLLRRELLRRGYKGDRFTKPINGKIYTYMKEF
ncbi:histidine phosphatase family protein [Paenibacillus sp. N3/727]|uniref:histidine phosphatase family protein n=1 Tax=Paenibacillus sp. N3/727 TaxID=2925845 RepID=UPI001F536070|nr:histidine phosphatase family protein [Paenibacillus sp. N3/727]UNK17001.1 histidine phosphatase family protein [Paenibacillus sp. N3/727]